MIAHTLDTTRGILHIQPKSALEQADFEQLAKAVDPFIAGPGDLTGLIVAQWIRGRPDTSPP